MRRRPLPDAAETAEILGRFRTRPPRQAPPPVGRNVARLLKPFEDRFGVGPQALAARWREIVGDTLALQFEPAQRGWEEDKPHRPNGCSDRSRTPGTQHVHLARIGIGKPVKLSKPRGGGPASLEIRVDGPSAALIQHQAGEILSRVNLFLGQGAVAKLRIVQGPVRSTPARTPPRKPPPLDALAEAQLAKSLADAPDGPLKDSLLKLGRAVLQAEARRTR